MKQLFPFNELKNILELQSEEEAFDLLIYEATISYCENLLQRDFENEMPSDLKEAIIKLFLIKKSEMTTLKNGENITENIPESIRNVFDFYKVKKL